MHPLFWLAFVTFLLVVGFLVWNRASTARHSFGRKATGIGGVNDPLAGATEDLRAPDKMRASLDQADVTPLADRKRQNR